MFWIDAYDGGYRIGIRIGIRMGIRMVKPQLDALA